ncbi:MAG: energy transducer TonB [Betaproteobacteria bacterium]|nr:energy transducer TonB [Betaproteobacteria bacterium]
MQNRILGPIVAAVLLVHGAVVFFSLRTAVPVPPEVTAVVAFFVSPAVPPSPPVRAASAERRPAPRPDPAPQAVAPQPQPLVSQPTRPIETSAPSVAASTPQATSQLSPAQVPSEPSEPASRVSPAVPAPASEPAPAAPVAVSIDAVRYLKPPQVVYPPLSRRMGETGRVVVRVLVDAQGVPTEVTLAEPSRFARLNDQALQAMRQARFEPYRVNGRPMSVTMLAPIVFTLEDRP